MVIVRVAEWLMLPAPLVDADTETLVVPIGVPGFPTTLLPPLHETSADAATIRSSRLKNRKVRCSRLRRVAIPKSMAKTGNTKA